MTVRSPVSHAGGGQRRRLARALTAAAATLVLLGSALPVVQASHAGGTPDDLHVLTEGIATVNGAKDAEYVPIGTFYQDGDDGNPVAATLFALYDEAGCSGNGQLFLYIKMATPGLTVRTFDTTSLLEARYDANSAGGNSETVLTPSAGPSYNANRTGGELSACYTSVDGPAGQSIAVSFNFSVSPAVDEGRVALLSGATSTTDNGLLIATPTDAPVAPSGTFVPLNAPVRVLDTRVAGKGLQGKFTSRQWRTLNIGGTNTIPVDAIAVTGNLTVVTPDAAGSASVLTEVLAPNVAPPISSINVRAATTAANNLVAPLAADGSVAIVYWTGGTTAQSHLLLDVTGYFIPVTNQGHYVDITPARILHSGAGVGVPGMFTSGVSQTFPVWNQGGVPNTAIAVAGNLTVRDHTGNGNATLTTVADNNPATSTLNFKLNDNRANGIVIKLSGTGTLSAVVRGANANLIFDVTGYFVAGATGTIFHPISPTRIMDTRIDLGVINGFQTGVSRTLTVSPTGVVIPAGAVGVTGNVTVTQQTARGNVAATKEPDNNPPTSTLNFPVGENRANGIVGPLAGGEMSFVYKAGAGAATHLIFDATGYFSP